MRLSLLLLCLALFSCSAVPQNVGAPATPTTSVVVEASRPNPNPDLYDQLVIVGTNDFHGYLRPAESDFYGSKVLIGGAPWFAGYIHILQKKFGSNLILLDAGDLFQGTIESNLFLGKPVVRFYNLLPYRAAAVGNHEFDYGPRKEADQDRLGALKDRMAEARFPFVQANIFRNGSLWKEKNLFPSVLFQAGKYKVGVIGLTTTTTPAKTRPQNVAGMEFRDFLEPTMKEAQELRAKGADFVLITTHEGRDDGSTNSPVERLLKELPKGTVDAVVTGHSHTEIHEFIHGVPVIQSRARGLYFGRIDLFVNKVTKKIEPSLTYIHDMHRICGTWFKKEETCDQKAIRDKITAGEASAKDYLPLRKVMYEGEVVHPDAKVARVLRPFFAKADQKKKEILGEAREDFRWYPSGESQMGFLFLKAFHERFPSAKVIYLNGGGFRRLFFKGPISYGDLYEVNPFDNYGVEVRMTGKKLKDLLRLGVCGSHSIPAIWGVKVSYSKTDNPKFNRDIDGDGRFSTWERDRLLTATWQDGSEIRDTEEFWLATNDYLLSGGDNAEHIFSDIPDRKKHFSELGQRDIAAEYLRRKRGMDLPTLDENQIKVVQ